MLSRIKLSKKEINSLKKNIYALALNDEIKNNFKKFEIDSKKIVYQSLESSTILEIEKIGYRDDAVLSIENLPLRKVLPETPINGRLNDLETWKYEISVITGLSALIGNIYSFKNEKEGDIIHSVSAVEKSKEIASNEGSMVKHKFHTEIAYESLSKTPDIIALLCVRGDSEKQAITNFSDIEKAIKLMSKKNASILKENNFIINAPKSFKGKDILPKLGPIVNRTETGHYYYKINFNSMEGISQEAKKALLEFEEKLEEIKEGVRLKEGQLLFIPNRRYTHMRSIYNAKYDGKDRLLFRTYIKFDMNLISENIMQTNSGFVI